MPPVSLGWKGIQEQTVSSCVLGLEAGKADNDYPRLFRLSAVTSAIWIITYDLGQNNTVYHSLLKMVHISVLYKNEPIPEGSSNTEVASGDGLQVRG